jgi:multimeric flavodoxin WrbA
MIRIAAIVGSPVKDGNTAALVAEALQPFAADPEARTRVFHLDDREIAGCRHCNWCLKNQTPEKFCAISDGMDAIYPALVESDVILLATPVHIGRMSGLMANMIDRLRVFIYGNRHGETLKDKVGAGLIVAFLRHGGLESTLSLFNQTFALFQMIPVGRGGLALSSLEGKGKVAKGIRHMVLRDDLGLLSARNAVQRAVEIARIIQAGKKALKGSDK